VTVVRLHLNGGPYDDRYMDHWTSTLEVTALRGWSWAEMGVVEDEAVPSPTTRSGRYVLRVDGNGEPVPHNLEGFVEADWQGWDQ